MYKPISSIDDLYKGMRVYCQRKNLYEVVLDTGIVKTNGHWLPCVIYFGYDDNNHKQTFVKTFDEFKNDFIEYIPDGDGI